MMFLQAFFAFVVLVSATAASQERGQTPLPAEQEREFVATEKDRRLAEVNDYDTTPSPSPASHTHHPTTTFHPTTTYHPTTTFHPTTTYQPTTTLYPTMSEAEGDYYETTMSPSPGSDTHHPTATYQPTTTYFPTKTFLPTITYFPTTSPHPTPSYYGQYETSSPAPSKEHRGACDKKPIHVMVDLEGGPLLFCCAGGEVSLAH